MPFELTIYPETGLALATCSGMLGLREAQEGVRSLWEHPAWPGDNVVWDFRTARLEFTSVEVRELAQFVLAHQPARPPKRVAFVTSHDMDFGLVRMFEVFRDHPSTDAKAFRELEPALAWAVGQEPWA